MRNQTKLRFEYLVTVSALVIHILLLPVSTLIFKLIILSEYLRIYRILKTGTQTSSFVPSPLLLSPLLFDLGLEIEKTLWRTTWFGIRTEGVPYGSENGPRCTAWFRKRTEIMMF